MTDPEDVLEYVDAAVKHVHVHVLLKWLASISEKRDRRMSLLDVRVNLLLSSCLLSSFCLRPIVMLHNQVDLLCLAVVQLSHC